jgi:integrase
MRNPTPREGADGRWHAWVTVGRKANGRPDQRHIKRRTEAEAQDEIDKLLEQRRAGAVQRPGRAPTVRRWLLDVYLDVIAPLKIDPTTVYGYRSKITNHVLPVIGARRMDDIEADDIDAIYLAMRRKGLADATILQVHRILSRAWRVAARRRVVTRNIMRDDVDPPTVQRIEREALTLDDALAVLDAAAGRRNSARWSVGLALGPRQGEALGLRWAYLVVVCGECDHEVPLTQWWGSALAACPRCAAAGVGVEARVWWQLHRRPFEHGCRGAPCGRRRAGSCPQRVLPLRSGEVVLEGGLILKPPKGKSRRTVPVPQELVDQLRAHGEVQCLERQFAGGALVDFDLVFTKLDGRPIDPSSDWDEWSALLAEAGVPHARVHDGRHTAATLLLAQGVELRVVQEILGHSKISVTEGYTHVSSEMARDATDRMGKSLLGRRRGQRGE